MEKQKILKEAEQKAQGNIKKDARVDMMQLQHTLRNNQRDLQSYFEELDQWTNEVSKANPKSKNSKKVVEMPLPPIRNKVEAPKKEQKVIQDKQKSAPSKEGDIFTADEVQEQKSQNLNIKDGKDQKQLKRDITPMFDYYKAWDKFAKEEVDNADKDNESYPEGYIAPSKVIPEKEKQFTQAEMMQRTSGAKPNTKLVIKGGTVKKSNQADFLKQQGNAFFQAHEFEKAIDSYTRCIPQIPESDHSLQTIVYSNRAQCNLKLKRYENAFQDANQALNFDANHLKSIQRRGTAAYYTQRLREARRDFLRSLSLEFSENIADYLRKVIEQINKSKLLAQEKLKRKVLFNSGIDFCDLNKYYGDVDKAKKGGIDEFKRQSIQFDIQEMNIDQQQLKELQTKKQSLIEQQKHNNLSSTSTSACSIDDSQKNLIDENIQGESQQQPKKNKKKKNKKNNKSVLDFMDDEEEAAAFAKQDEKIELKVTNQIEQVTEQTLEKSDDKNIKQVNECKEPQANSEEVKASEDDELEKENYYNDDANQYENYMKSKQPQPSILMKDNEHSGKKSVKFDESQNLLKEFHKSQKIEVGINSEQKWVKKDKAKQQLKQKNKKWSPKEVISKELKQIDNEQEIEDNSPGVQDRDENKNEINNIQKPHDKPKEQDKQSAIQNIQALKNSDAIIQARDEFILSKPPKNYYQFERDFKTYKNDKIKLLKYIMNVDIKDLKTIFKSDLDPDILIQIFGALLAQDELYFKENSEFLIELSDKLSSVKPFELACEFMMEDEKAVIRKFIHKIKDYSNPQIQEKVDKLAIKFNKICQ